MGGRVERSLERQALALLCKYVWYEMTILDVECGCSVSAKEAVAAIKEILEETEALRSAANILIDSAKELLHPLEQASAEMVAHGQVLDEAGEATFDRARKAILLIEKILAVQNPAPRP